MSLSNEIWSLHFLSLYIFLMNLKNGVDSIFPVQITIYMAWIGFPPTTIILLVTIILLGKLSDQLRPLLRPYHAVITPLARR